MSSRLDELPSGTVVVLITFGDDERLAAYDDRSDYEFPILVDPDRSTYRSYGLGRGTLRRVWGWRMMRSYLGIFRSAGRRPIKGPTDDTLQLGGDFVIGPDGELAYGFWGEGPDDRPAVDDLIGAVRQSL